MCVSVSVCSRLHDVVNGWRISTGNFLLIVARKVNDDAEE